MSALYMYTHIDLCPVAIYLRLLLDINTYSTYAWQRIIEVYNVSVAWFSRVDCSSDSQYLQ